jgi:hypothetical protein
MQQTQQISGSLKFRIESFDLDWVSRFNTAIYCKAILNITCSAAHKFGSDRRRSGHVADGLDPPLMTLKRHAVTGT